MCGRFTLRTPLEQLIDQFRPSSMPQQLPLRFNTAPTQNIAVLRTTDAHSRELTLLRWGLIPSWAKDKSIGNRMINARAETLAIKPSFRTAFKRRRCLVLTDGYFEWKKTKGKKQPYYIRMENERPFVMAGLWERWPGPQDAPLALPLETCTIITVEANEETQSVHGRMPAIINERQIDPWLDTQMQDSDLLTPMLTPLTSDHLRIDPVSTHVNNARNDDPSCIAVQTELF
jgi:putative SOS response-associated peptidase YedK